MFSSQLPPYSRGGHRSAHTGGGNVVKTLYTVCVVAAGAATAGLCWRWWSANSSSPTQRDATCSPRDKTTAPSVTARTLPPASPVRYESDSRHDSPLAVKTVRAAASGSTVLSPEPGANPAAISPSLPPVAVSRQPRGPSMKSAAADDDDDMFAVPNGPRLFSQDYRLPERQRSQASPRRAESSSAVLATLRAAEAVNDARQSSSPSRATVNTVQPAALRQKDPTQVWSPEIVRRDRAVHLLRALLRELEGTTDDKEDDDSSLTNSDETDVSLNYHLASEFELQARDAVMEAMDAYESTREDAVAEGLDEEDELVAQLEMDNLIKLVEQMMEYLDMSNEREKLMLRREQLYLESGLPPPPRDYEEGPRSELFNNPAFELGQPHSRRHLLHQGIGAPVEGDGDMEIEVDFNTDASSPLDSTSPLDFREALGHQSKALEAAYATMMGGGGGTDMDRMLHYQQPHMKKADIAGGARHPMAGGALLEEAFEDDWDDLQDTEEADFMAYLDQDDGAEHFQTPAEVRQARRMREAHHEDVTGGGHAHDADDYQIIANDGRSFEQMLNAMTGRGVANEHDDDDHDWIDDGEDDDEMMYEEGEDEEMEPPIPWTMKEKAEFEEDLLTRVQDLMDAYSITDAMGQRAKLVDEEARRRRHEAAAVAKARLADVKRDVISRSRGARPAPVMVPTAETADVVNEAVQPARDVEDDDADEEGWVTDEDEIIPGYEEDQGWYEEENDEEADVEGEREEDDDDYLDEEEGEWMDEAYEEEEEGEWLPEDEEGQEVSPPLAAPVAPAKFERVTAVPPARFMASRSLTRGGSPTVPRSPSEPALTSAQPTLKSTAAGAATNTKATATTAVKPALLTTDSNTRTATRASNTTTKAPNNTVTSTAAKAAVAKTAKTKHETSTRTSAPVNTRARK